MRSLSKLNPLVLVSALAALGTVQTKGTSAWAAQNCPRSCEEFFESMKEAEQKLKRLGEILAANQQFESELTPEDEGQRVKVRSNINIARKRITQAEQALLEAKAEVSRPECAPCGFKVDPTGDIK